MQVSLLSDLDYLSVTQVLIGALTLLTLAFYVYATSYHGVWEKHRVPGPKPWPVLDHRLDLRDGVEATFKKWFQMYGNTFGAYGLLPRRPTLVTKDLSLIKQILVKDFDNFSYRIRSQPSDSSFKNGLSSAGGNRWRRHRLVTSPMFTGSRMKIIMKHVCANAETLAQLVKHSLEKKELIPVKAVSSKFSAEVIARIGFGITSHEVSKAESEFAAFSRKLVRFTPIISIISSLRFYFPPIDRILRLLRIDHDFIDRHADNYFVSILKSSIEVRQIDRKRSNGRKARDMLDFFIEAAVENGDPRLNDTNCKSLSTDEIIGNSTNLILAGVETVSSALPSIIYCLVIHPEVQDKVVKEINNVVPTGKSLAYEHLHDLKYTEQVIFECLRLYPFLTSVHRLAGKTKEYNGIIIPAGSAIQIPIGLIMKDPENWPNPEKFDPDRFSAENKVGREPLAFMPFGYGPRICLGMRLAILELKVILVYLLREVRFTLSDRTEPMKGENMEMQTIAMAFCGPAKPLEVEVRTIA